MADRTRDPCDVVTTWHNEPWCRTHDCPARENSNYCAVGLRTSSGGARVHRLKTWPEFYEHVLTGAKPFEVRRDDRHFQPGDVLHLREYDRRDGYTGRSLYRRVTYLFDLGCPMVGAPGFVVMGLAPADDEELLPAASGG